MPPTSRLQAARLKAGMTQDALAELVGVQQPHIARWETGTQLPRVDAALRIATALGTTVEALFGGIRIYREETRVGEDELEPTPRYAVERLLRQAFPAAAKPQPSGLSVDVRLYFREKPDGSLWGGVAFLDGEGKMHDFGDFRQLPLDAPEAMPWLLSVLCDLGFEAAPERRTKPRRPS